MLFEHIRRRWYRLLRVGPTVMLLALLPSLLYLDHWSSYIGSMMGWTVMEEDPAEHAGHCHYGPSTCSEQPVLVNVTGQPVVVELPEPALPFVAMADESPSVEQLYVEPLTEPPWA